ncbi:MAG: DUF58 domain-containing protein [Deltaproteobacteria bacterium]|nr:DUF58 domain-containing protein [Deltaproteobacteria bacterium]
MNLRPTLSVPLPWLTIFIGRAFGKDKPPAAKRGGIRAMLKPPRSLSVTREGKWYIGILFLIGIAAINTGNNLLYLVVSMLLALIVISGVISEHTLRRLAVSRAWPAHVFKDAPATVRLEITSRKRRLPTFSVHLKEIPTDGCETDGTFVLRLDPGKTSTRAVRYTFTRRGIIKLNGVKVSTRFPFGLFLKGKEERSPDEVLVYPKIDQKLRLRVDEAAHAQDGSRVSGKGAGSELYGLREYTMQDPARFIFWKAAAKASKLLVREFEQDSEKRITIIFENFQSSDPAVFERLVDEAASTVDYLIGRGFSVGIKTLSTEIKPAPGAAQLYPILRLLALIEPAGPNGAPGIRVMHG